MSTVSSQLTPDDARELVEAELAQAQYQDIKTPLQLLQEWLDRVLSYLFGLDANPQANWAWLIIAVIIVVVVGLSWRLLSARNARLRKEQQPVFTSEPLRDAKYWLQRGSQASSSGDLQAAVIYNFRSLLLASPGLDQGVFRGKTAREASEILLAHLGLEYRGKLQRATEIFEHATYSHDQPRAADVEWLAEVSAQVVNQPVEVTN